VDKNKGDRARLFKELNNLGAYCEVQQHHMLHGARVSLTELQGNVDAIFIDILSFNLVAAVNFVAQVRERIPRPAFVLYVDMNSFRKTEHELAADWRERFRHYLKLDKGPTEYAFRDRLSYVLDHCRLYVGKTPIEKVRDASKLGFRSKTG
jgi:hypothetical protein